MKRTLFITGGSRGIGAAIVLEAARTGWNVAFTFATREDAAAEVAAAARGPGDGVTVKYWPLDVRDAEAVDAVVDDRRLAG